MATNRTKNHSTLTAGKKPKGLAWLWFTLAELIVVITVLAILATVGFLALSGYSQDAKDASVKANVRSVQTAISSESAISGNSPRYYVVHDSSAALSGAFVYFDGNPVALTGGDWSATWTNYSAGNPDYRKLKLNPDKFKVGSLAFPSAFAAYDSKYLSVWAVDVGRTENWKNRAASFFQVAGVSPATGVATVSGNYPALSGSVAWLVKNPTSASLTGALVDGSKSEYAMPSTCPNAGYSFVSGSCVPDSCRSIKNAYPSSADGAYSIDPDWAGSAYAPFEAYCDMTNDGGGWTLALKAQSSSSTFTYDSAYWNDTATLNASSANLTNSDAKFPPYYATAWTQLRFCMNNSGWKCVTKNYLGNVRDFAQQQTTNQVGYVAGSTSDANASAWISGLGFSNASLAMIFCNGQHSWAYTFVKIGVNSNDSVAQWCNSTDDYAWGFGLKNTLSWANYGAGFGRTGSSWTPMQGAIYVR